MPIMRIGIMQGSLEIFPAMKPPPSAALVPMTDSMLPAVMKFPYITTISISMHAKSTNAETMMANIHPRFMLAMKKHSGRA